MYYIMILFILKQNFNNWSLHIMKYAKNLMKQNWANSLFFFLIILLTWQYFFILEMISLSRKIKLMIGVLYIRQRTNNESPILEPDEFKAMLENTEPY